MEPRDRAKRLGNRSRVTHCRASYVPYTTNDLSSTKFLFRAALQVKPAVSKLTGQAVELVALDANTEEGVLHTLFDISDGSPRWVIAARRDYPACLAGSPNPALSRD
jgi:hypothetical protein